MKKFLISLFIAASVLLVNAQTVIRSDYSKSTSSYEVSTVDDYETKGLVSLNHYLDFGKFNLSVRGAFLNPNSFGVDYGWTMVDGGDNGIVSTDCLMFDLGPNYSFLLSSSEKTNLYLTLGLGPSMDFTTIYDNNSKETKSKTKFYVDAFINPNLIFMYKRLFVSLGYCFRAPQFKFSKKDGADGYLALGIGWDI